MSGRQKGDFSYILIYLFEFITGIAFFLMVKGDARKKQHSIQAVILGIISIIVAIIFFFMPVIADVIDAMIWIYGMYIGYMASIGSDADIPYITDFAKKYI
jgi:uncharacterized membrane protein